MTHGEVYLEILWKGKWWRSPEAKPISRDRALNAAHLARHLYKTKVRIVPAKD